MKPTTHWMTLNSLFSPCSTYWLLSLESDLALMKRFNGINVDLLCLTTFSLTNCLAFASAFCFYDAAAIIHRDRPPACPTVKSHNPKEFAGKVDVHFHSKELNEFIAVIIHNSLESRPT